MNNKTKKGFTLIELLIVIGILAVLAGAVILVINPAEMLAQARDTKRISDLSTIKSALSLYVSQVSPIDMTATNAAGNCMVGVGADNAPFHAASSPFCVTNAVRTTTGSGWVDVNLSGITGGSPVSVLPADPVNDATHFYAYKGNDTVDPKYTYKLATVLESTKYSPMMVNTADGGIAAGFYETGTNLAL